MVYLIHFHEKIAHAEHYIGYCDEDRLEARLAEHRRGQGSRILQVCKERGIEWDVVRVWPNTDRHFERRLKKAKNSRKLCPCCTAKTLKYRTTV